MMIRKEDREAIEEALDMAEEIIQDKYPIVHRECGVFWGHLKISIFRELLEERRARKRQPKWWEEGPR